MGWTIADNDALLPTAWIIDTDHLFEPGDGTGAVGVTGPGNAPTVLLERLVNNRKAGVTFRIFDDDGELYFTGRIIALNEDGTEQTAASCGEEFFRPLWDYGTPDSGATEIRYFIDGKWAAL